LCGAPFTLGSNWQIDDNSLKVAVKMSESGIVVTCAFETIDYAIETQKKLSHLYITEIEVDKSAGLMKIKFTDQNHINSKELEIVELYL
jgi:hypothetical protein